MIETARKVFPGVVVSVMLAAPSLASASTTNPSPDATETGKTSQRSGAVSHSSTQATRRSGTRTYASRYSVRHTYASPLVRRVHYTPARQTAFINDGVAWSEPGRDTADGVGRPFQSQPLQTGMASWYGGSRWNGHRTANGETYNDEELTGAHSSLPIGSLVRVTVLDTGRTVVVRINDRIGTHHRVIDLSRAAAHALGIENRGIAQVALAPQ